MSKEDKPKIKYYMKECMREYRTEFEKNRSKNMCKKHSTT